MSAIAHVAAVTAATPAPPAGWWSANAVAVLTLLSGVVGGVFAAIKWRSDEKRNRTAAALERIKSFDETPGTRNAMMILKSRKRPIPIFDSGNPPTDHSGIYRDIGWEEAKSALIPTRWNKDTSPLGNAIRDSFEDFFNRMTQVEIYTASGQIDAREARSLASAWGRRLLWDGDGGLARNIRVYVELEGYAAFQALFLRFGFDLRKVIADDIAGLKKENQIVTDEYGDQNQQQFD